VTAATWTCLLLPLASTIVITVGGTLISRRVAGWISTVTLFGSFVAACVSFGILLGEDPAERSHTTTSWTWLSAGQYHFGLSLLTDQLSVMMMLIVSGVGGLIILYSLGYMHGENEERRYFAYMSLFAFSMLLLVQAANLLLLLAGWGMVGLSSYLLIGFYQERPSAIAAAKKAFVMNAIGDATFALALFLLVQQTGTLNYSTVFAAAPTSGASANLIALGLLGGALAKSAQIPLHTWLPDAMEGPTPVSALIHAATMVTAGVYLIVRCHTLFENAYVVRDLAAGLGAATLLMAGLIALVQVDIKRVIAYSTMSQIGYMFVAAGLGAFANAMFHLMTHAFFKALLFLAAGLVIHALAGEQDIRKLAGVGKLMPKTRAVFLIGSLALAGIFPFAGFFSKDEILSAALASGWYGHVLYVIGMIGAFLTGLYTFRLVFIVFTGEPTPFVREHYHAHKGKEGPFTMLVVVFVLAVLSTIAGFIQWEPLWGYVSKWLDPVAPPIVVPTSRDDWVSSGVAIVLALVGAGVAWAIYSAKRVEAPKPWAVLEHKFYWDEIYDVVFYRSSDLLARSLGALVERPLIGGSLSLLGEGVSSGARELGRAQTGLVRSYALALTAGLAVLLVVFIAVK
jgi:NADH-quinone oxidoreductase subunit L